jgi:hypothetical protein
MDSEEMYQEIMHSNSTYTVKVQIVIRILTGG